MDIDNKDFYPTPDDVIKKMCEKVILLIRKDFLFCI